jgi:hypothetical protein
MFQVMIVFKSTYTLYLSLFLWISTDCNREVVGSNLNKAPSCTDFLQSLQVNEAFKRNDFFLACHSVDNKLLNF